MTKDPRIGLCLSGGGFRATFFHLGLIRFLRRYGLLNRVTQIASVSGGSILAAHLVLNWDRYTGSDEAYAAAEKELIDFGRRGVRGRIVRRWLFSILFPVLRLLPLKVHRTTLLEREYAHLLNGALLRDIEPGERQCPTLHLLATSFTTGRLCSFSSEGFWRHDDEAPQLHRTGMLPLALAVASSSAFPPMFPPTAITRKMLDASNAELPYDPEYLTDGGIFDNLGFAGFARVLGSDDCSIDHLILSDAGAQLDWDISGRFARVISRTIRSTDILMQRVADFTVAGLTARTSRATMFHLPITRLVLPSEGGKPLLVDFQKKLAKIRTDLNSFTPLEIKCLAQHGEEVALAELTPLVAAHPEFETLARTSVAPLDIPSKALPAAARHLDQSRSRRLGLFDLRDWVSYALFGYLTAAVSLAIFPYVYVAKRAVEGDLFQQSVQLAFATNRKPEPNSQFTADVDNRLHMGSAAVHVPREHAFGNLELPGGVFPFNRKTGSYFALRSIAVNDKPQLSADGGVKGVLVHIHGYNVTFENALIRTAQLAYDLNYAGQAVAYSWPSQATSFGYSRDRETASSSVQYFVDYIKALNAGNIASIDVVAEGLGSLVLFDAAIRLTDTAAATTSKKPFGQLVFVVPDVDLTRFVQQVELVARSAERITVLIAPNSLTVRAAAIVSSGSRAGGDPKLPELAPGIQTVLLPDEQLGENRREILQIIEAALQRRPLSSIRRLEQRRENAWELPP